MNINEVLAACIDLDSSRSYCAREDKWFHHDTPNHRAGNHTFCISVHPGIRGDTCSQFEGASYEEAFERYKHAHTSPEQRQKRAEAIQRRIEELKKEVVELQACAS